MNSGLGKHVFATFAAVLIAGGVATAWIAGERTPVSAESLADPPAPERKDPGKDGKITPEEIDAFLAKEIKRLRAATKSEQADVAEIQAGLTDKTTVEDLKKLIDERREKLIVASTERLKKEYLWLYSYGEKHAPSAEAREAGAELDKVGEQLKKMRDGDVRLSRVKDALSDTDDQATYPSVEDRRYLLERTAPLEGQIRQFSTKRRLSWAPKDGGDPSKDEISINPMDVFTFAAARIKALELDGDAKSASALLSDSLNLLSRCEFRGRLIPLVVMQVARSALLRCAISVAPSAVVPVATLEEWLKHGSGAKVDIVEAMAVEIARFVRHGGDDMNWRAQAAKGTSEYMTRECGLTSLEEWIRWLVDEADGMFRLFEYAAKRPGEIRTLAQFKDAARAMSGLRSLTEPNRYDAYTNNLEWAGLELKILERKVGSLKEHKDEVAEVLKKYDGLRTEWLDKKLELWPLMEIRRRGPWPRVIAIDLAK